MPQQERSFGRLAAGVLLAPLAGTLAAMVVTYLYALIFGNDTERTIAGAWKPAAFVGFWTFFVCVAYTLIVGGAAFAYSAIKRRGLSSTFAIVTGLLLGAVPFSLLLLLRRGQPFRLDVLAFPLIAIVASIATAWAFWRIALARTRTHA
jgi:hypothetical protein